MLVKPLLFYPPVIDSFSIASNSWMFHICIGALKMDQGALLEVISMMQYGVIQLLGMTGEPKWKSSPAGS